MIWKKTIEFVSLKTEYLTDYVSIVIASRPVTVRLVGVVFKPEYFIFIYIFFDNTNVLIVTSLINFI